MHAILTRVEEAISQLKQGKMVILIDDPRRENEGDLIVVAEKISLSIMNFMIKHGSGIVCLTLTKADAKKLELPLMVPFQDNGSLRKTPFTVSIDAKNGISTGVSSQDRVKTIHTAVQDNVRPSDLAKPGHIFPLQAMDEGVLERGGHTEGATDLARLAGFKPSAVLCELMNKDGTMMRGEKLFAFAKAHALSILTIEDLIFYRRVKENNVIEEASAPLPLENYGLFTITVIKERISREEHILLTKEKKDPSQPTLVRIHSSCKTGDLFSSKRCDCHKQLHYSLARIAEEGGMLIYLDQEGRGIGLLNKIKAYALQEKGYDTVAANEALGLPADARKYYIAANILRNHQMKEVRLLTNNPNKIEDLQKYGIPFVTREPIPLFFNEYNKEYIKTKQKKLYHLDDYLVDKTEKK